MVVAPDLGAEPYKLCMTKAEWDEKKIANAKDPEHLICEYQEQIGTRLRSYKVCLTAAEWAIRRQADRSMVEWIQGQSCVPGGGC